MNRTTPQRRSSSRRQTSVPSTPPREPQTIPQSWALARTSSTPVDIQPSLGREAEEGEYLDRQDGDGGSPIEDSQTGASLGQETDGNSSTPATHNSPLPRQRPHLTAQNPTPGYELAPITPELARWIRLRSQNLKLRQSDRQWAVDLVNHLRDSLLVFLKNSDEQPYFQSASVLNSGSYYEMVKIHNPNEFDMMLKLQSPSRLKMTELDQYHGLFYEVALSRPTRAHIRSFLLEDGLTISASKIIREMHRLVRKFISTYKVPGNSWRWVVKRKRPNSPAVTLSLLELDNGKEELLSVDVVPALEVPSSQSWPLAARAGPDVNNWLGKKTRRSLTHQTCFFVPKKPPGRNLSEAAKESWRISFSHIEKELIKTHGNKRTCCESSATKCCRKQCFKLLKCLIEGLKKRYPQELDALCSYHGKTVFLHTLSIRAQDSLWTPHHLPACFMHLLGALEGHARSGLLPHFFVPTSNLFAAPTFPRKALVFLTEALEEQRRQGLPLLMPPAPAPPLAVHSPSNSQSQPSIVVQQTHVIQSTIIQPPKVIETKASVKMFNILALVVALVCVVCYLCPSVVGR
ncbi:cyclic GMP-AMP synthase isoform X2 [Oncorhynchus tshawytscha]|uniref:Cyclic GMP-AMP synthase n=1 Tax=Oncorhynchus tshawytscha TaxID=74940 RepID=A0A8C8H9I0_ONCTS|nr:cyclic GMP-AMP synthase isoform X2 [Oncorhynchus tshawytscha]